jgi:hypothetical protein
MKLKHPIPRLLSSIGIPENLDYTLSKMQPCTASWLMFILAPMLDCYFANVPLINKSIVRESASASVNPFKTAHPISKIRLLLQQV